MATKVSKTKEKKAEVVVESDYALVERKVAERSVLETICMAVENRIEKGQEIDYKRFPEYLGRDLTPGYQTFAQQYTELSRKYNDLKKELIPVSILSNFSEIDEVDIFLGAGAGCALGYLAGHPIIGAIAGCVVSLFNDVYKYDLDLENIAFGAGAGFAVGSMAEAPALGVMCGAAVGALTIASDFYNKRQKRISDYEQNKEQLARDYMNLREKLIEKTILKLVEN